VAYSDHGVLHNGGSFACSTPAVRISLCQPGSPECAAPLSKVPAVKDVLRWVVANATLALDVKKQKLDKVEGHGVTLCKSATINSRLAVLRHICSLDERPPYKPRFQALFSYASYSRILFLKFAMGTGQRSTNSTFFCSRSQDVKITALMKSMSPWHSLPFLPHFYNRKAEGRLRAFVDEITLECVQHPLRLNHPCSGNCHCSKRQ